MELANLHALSVKYRLNTFLGNFSLMELYFYF